MVVTALLFNIHSLHISLEFTLVLLHLPRREVGLLKELWDMITVVEANMAAWRTTPWREIQVEDLELECKRLSKDIRSLDKEVRGENGGRTFNIQRWMGKLILKN